MSARRSAPSPGFWSLITRLEGHVDESGATALVEHLEEQPVEEILDFEVSLQAALAALDTAALTEHLDASAAAGPAGLSDDGTLYARCWIVAQGRAAWRRAVTDPTTVTLAADHQDGEHLLGVARSAHKEATGLGWPGEEPAEEATDDGVTTWVTHGVVHRQTRPWFGIGGGRHDSVPWRPTYVYPQKALVSEINVDPAWRTWWARCPQRDLEVYHWIGPEPEGHDLVRRRVRVRLDVATDGAFLDEVVRRELLSRASSDLLAILGIVTSELGLGELPPLPDLGPLPYWLDLESPDGGDAETNRWHAWLPKISWTD